MALLAGTQVGGCEEEASLSQWALRWATHIQDLSSPLLVWMCLGSSSNFMAPACVKRASR